MISLWQLIWEPHDPRVLASGMGDNTLLIVFGVILVVLAIIFLIRGTRKK